MRVDRVLDGRSERRDLSDERSQDGDERANTLALGIGLELTGDAGWCGAQALDELGGSATAGVRVTREKRRHPLLAETARGLRGRVPVEELERDGGVDVGEDLRSARPEL